MVRKLSVSFKLWIIILTIFLEISSFLAGAFLSYETRELKILTLNDTFWTGIAVYCVVTLTIVSAPLSFILSNDPRVSYAVVGGLAWVAVTLTILIVYVPKVKNLIYFERKQKERNMEKTGNENDNKSMYSKSTPAVDLSHFDKRPIREHLKAAVNKGQCFIFSRSTSRGFRRLYCVFCCCFGFGFFNWPWQNHPIVIVPFMYRTKPKLDMLR